MSAGIGCMYRTQPRCITSPSPSSPKFKRMTLLRCLRGSSGAGCVRHIQREHMLQRVACFRCLTSGGAPRGPHPQTCHSHRSDTHTPLESHIQVRYCRYSRLHRSELPKSFWYVGLPNFRSPLRSRGSPVWRLIEPGKPPQ